MIQDRKYSMAIEVPGDLAAVRERTVEALARAGFGILTEIDVAATLKKKLGVDTTPYVILGACNPPLAHQALAAEPDLGVLLPCSVVVYAGAGGTCTVSALDPVRQFSLVENAGLAPVAEEVRARLRGALEEVRAGSAA